MIPRRFFWLFDFCFIVTAFMAAYAIVEGFSRSLPENVWVGVFPTFLSVPLNSRGPRPPLAELVWMLFSFLPVALTVLGVLGNHEPIIRQSRTRIVAGSVVASLAGLGLISTALFALLTPHWSRLFAFSFVVLSTLGLILYRLVLRMYFLQRRAVGYYAQNIVLLGSAGALEWMCDYFKQYVPSEDYRLLGYFRID